MRHVLDDACENRDVETAAPERGERAGVQIDDESIGITRHEIGGRVGRIGVDVPSHLLPTGAEVQDVRPSWYQLRH
jgi:hypothetical protein